MSGPAGSARSHPVGFVVFFFKHLCQSHTKYMCVFVREIK